MALQSRVCPYDPKSIRTIPSLSVQSKVRPYAPESVQFPVRPCDPESVRKIPSPSVRFRVRPYDSQSVCMQGGRKIYRSELCLLSSAISPTFFTITHLSITNVISSSTSALHFKTCKKKKHALGGIMTFS